MSHIDLVVHEYAPAIRFFVDVPGFELVDDFELQYRRLIEARVRFVRGPRVESYSTVAVFLDIAGNRWNLVGPA